MSSKQDRALEPVGRHPNQGALDRADIVIIGNGIAGLTAALEARDLAPDKRIVVITNQIHPTINTPALKQFAIGKLNREQLLAFPAGTERAKRIHVVTAQVEEIHARSKYVTLSGNRGFGYNALLIATGSAPQGLPEHLPGRNFDGVITLHRLQDYLDLRRRIGEVSEAVVVGGGVHAIETVMGLRHWGIHVHWLIRGSTFMRNMLDAAASDMVLEHIRHKGVTIHTETEIVGVMGRVGAVAGVFTNQQQMVPCQLVAACTGTQPASELADQCSIPLKRKHGIIVDDKLRSSVRDIYAAGDVAALLNPQTGRYEPRAQWYAATFQGKIAGAMLAGDSDRARQPFGVQWHATHLGDLSMLTVGDALTQGDKVLTLTDTSQGGYRRITIVDDRLVGYLSLGNKQPDSLAIKRIIDEGHPVKNITKALLKGNFDARSYVSKLRSRAAEGIVTTRQLPELIPNPPSTVQLLPVGKQPSQLPSTGEIIPVDERQPEPQVVQMEEEFNPFTGNLPSIGQQFAEAHEMRSTGTELWVDEINPFTGNLPDIQSPAGGAQSVSGRSLQRGLLSSYSAKLAAVERASGPAREGTVEATGQRQITRNLWSYTQQRTPAREEDKR